MSSRSLAIVLASVALLAACTRSSLPPDARPRVAIVYDSAVPDEREIVAPSVLAARLGLREGGLTPVDLDVRGDPAAATGMIRAAVDDPATIGVVVAPFVVLPAPAWDVLAAADVAVLSVNQLTPDGGVRAMVPPFDRIGAALIDEAPGLARCVAAGDDTWGLAFAEALMTVDGTLEPATSGCDQLIWSGPAPATPAASAVVTDQARTASFLRARGPADGTPRSVCGCLDPGSMVTPPLQSFVHGYQAETGLDPGPYAAEAYDAATILVTAWRGTSDRAAVAQAVSDLDAYEGVAGTYRWSGPILISPGPRAYVALGWRWVRRP